MEFENMTDEQVLQKLLDSDSVPEKTVTIPRLGIPVTIKGLTGKQVYSIQDKCTERTTRKGKVTEKLDGEQFNVSLINAATVKPNWGAQQLLDKFKASGPEEVIKRILLAGEMAALGDEVLEISGFDIELEEVKNS